MGGRGCRSCVRGALRQGPPLEAGPAEAPGVGAPSPSCTTDSHTRGGRSLAQARSPSGGSESARRHITVKGTALAGRAGETRVAVWPGVR